VTGFELPLIRARLAQNTEHPEPMDDRSFLDFASAAAVSPFSALLVSGGQTPRDDESRYSICAWEPFLVFWSKGRTCRVRMADTTFTFEANPLDVLDHIDSRLLPDFELEAPPFSGGAVGYLAYDLKNQIERLPQTAHDDLDLPDLLLFWPRRAAILDRLTGKVRLLIFRFEAPTAAPSGSPIGARQGIETADPSFANHLPGSYAAFQDLDAGPATESAGKNLQVGELTSNFTREAYLRAVARVRHYIRKGDVYQVNLSQRYRFPFAGDPLRLWRSLFELNPAPFYAYLHAGDHRVLSTSMERFLYRKGSYLETRPIKGTRKRGSTPEEDEALRRELLESPKDDAELSMIVDLLRNDLGRVCLPRTIRVAEHRRLESYQNVHHLVSIVIGELRPDTTHADVLRATFPGGSITGCPKIRAMEIIDELEPHVRHVYTGSIGYLGWHRNMDLSIAIRTALVHHGHCYFSVGGGIVFDSVEADEYEETLHKGRTLFQLLESVGRANR
jgi:para-aminobenzoate synthetase component 1